MRLFVAVGTPQIGVVAARGMVAILDEVACGIAAARAEIDGEHGLDLRGAAPIHELIGAERVGLGREPGEVQPGRTLIGRAHPVLPIVAGNEIAAGIAHDGRPELLDERQHVAPETLLVGGRMAGLVDAAVDATTKMLDEGAEQARVGLTDGEVAIEKNAGLPHVGILHKSRMRSAPS